MLTPIEDLGFSHDVEAADGDWDGLEKVHAKFTAQWYVDSNGLARDTFYENGKYFWMGSALSSRSEMETSG